MTQEELNVIIDEMMELYKRNQINKLVRIRDSNNELGERRLAANIVLQVPSDPRRNLTNED